MHLLDINVLIALCDEAHEFHEPAWKWFQPRYAKGWVTCPLTENGFIRILGHPAHPAGVGSMEAAREILEQFCRGNGHHFWPDESTLRDRRLFPSLATAGSKMLSDIYLLGLAASKKATFSTFDRRVEAGLVRNGEAALEVIAN
jgi:toxin-antitoxin system PIN domain toxin